MGAGRRKFCFGYPDGYGAAQYPPAYDSVFNASTYVQYQFRSEQKDKAPPDTAIPDAAGDLAQAEYKKKYAPADLPPHSGMVSFKGFGHEDVADFVFFQSTPTGPGALSFREWLRKNGFQPNKFPA